MYKYTKHQTIYAGVFVDEHNKLHINNNKDIAVNLIPMDAIVNLEMKKIYLDNVSLVYGLNDTFKQNVDNFMNIEVDLGVLKEPISHDKLFWEGS